MNTRVLLNGLLVGDLASEDRTHEIGISLDAKGQIVVEPARLEIVCGDRVRFSSRGSHRDRVEVEFEFENGTRGPFRARNQGDNPSRGRFNNEVGRDITTEPSDQRGEFKYAVFWLQADGRMIHLDPAIVVR